MGSVPKEPPETGTADARDVLAEVLLLLIESGCQWAREHPELKIRLRIERPPAADVIAVMLDPDADEAEGES